MVLYTYQIVFLLLGVWLARAQRLGEVCTRVDETRGRCKDLKECLSEGGSAESVGRLKLCSNIDFSSVIVCCRSNSAAIARRKCQDWQIQRKNSGSSCSVTIPLVRGGEEALVGEFPHMAVILAETERGSVHVCGGSLIAQDWVLTAAHCITRDKIAVRLGAHDLREAEQGISFVVNVLRIVVHPEFDLPRRYNDIALLQLGLEAPIRRRIQPACLPYKNNRVEGGERLVVAGWGKTGEGEPTSNVLRKAEVRSISRYACDQHTTFNLRRSSNTYPVGITDSIICVDEKDEGSCQGDSGGPLMLERSEACSQEVVGLVSRGILECKGTAVPGLYTRIEYYLDWIVNTVWRDEV